MSDGPRRGNARSRSFRNNPRIACPGQCQLHGAIARHNRLESQQPARLLDADARMDRIDDEWCEIVLAARIRTIDKCLVGTNEILDSVRGAGKTVDSPTGGRSPRIRE